MPTERQSESARINGAKSRGPKSAEGKTKSSRNSLRHGCTAGHTILLACEDRGDFNRMRKDYDAMYKPVTLEEENLVAEMFATAWRLRRATTIETALIDLEVVTEEPKLKARFDRCAAFTNRTTTCFSACASDASPNRPRTRRRRPHPGLRPR